MNACHLFSTITPSRQFLNVSHLNVGFASLSIPKQMSNLRLPVLAVDRPP